MQYAILRLTEPVHTSAVHFVALEKARVLVHRFVDAHAPAYPLAVLKLACKLVPYLLALGDSPFALSFGLLDRHIDAFHNLFQIRVLHEGSHHFVALLPCLLFHFLCLLDPQRYCLEKVFSCALVSAVHYRFEVVTGPVLGHLAKAMLL